MMAESMTNSNTTNATVEGNSTETTNNKVNPTNQNDKSSMEALMAELAQLKAEKAKDKSALDKAMKERAEAVKSLRAKQTAEELEAEEAAERQRLKDEEHEKVLAELNHIKAVSAYKDIEDEKLVETLIEAVAEGDHASIATVINNEVKKAVKAAEAEWLSSRPQLSAGNAYSSMTAEQIMAIKDSNERRKAIAQNLDLFN